MKENLIGWIAARVREKSTVAAIAGLGALFGLPTEEVQSLYDVIALIVPEDYAQVTTNLVGSIVALLLIVRKDRTKTEWGKKLNSPVWVLLLAASLVLTACGTLGMNKQQYAGINTVELQTGGGCSASDRQNQDTCKLVMVDGKEKAQVTIEVILADGTTYKYSAGEEKAFEGQALRAEVDKVVADKAAKVIEGAIDLVKPSVGGS